MDTLTRQLRREQRDSGARRGPSAARRRRRPAAACASSPATPAPGARGGGAAAPPSDVDEHDGAAATHVESREEAAPALARRGRAKDQPSSRLPLGGTVGKKLGGEQSFMGCIEIHAVKRTVPR